MTISSVVVRGQVLMGRLPGEKIHFGKLLSPGCLAPDTPSLTGSPPPQPFPQRLCSRFHLSLLALGFNILLLVAVCVIGSQSTQLQAELRILKESFSNFSSSTLMEVQDLGFRGDGAGDKVTSLGAKLEKQQQELKAGERPTCLLHCCLCICPLDHATLLLHLKHFPVDLRTLTCQMVFFQSNGTECCPVNWVEYEGSCYWFSRAGKTWSEADKYCQLENAHLVVINSREEQKFILQHTGAFHIWIGLTDSDGSWKWVDGTDYRHSYKNWAITQPDNWQGHELGGSEDCAEILTDGRWNDNFCQQVNRWACEMKRNITG
ncbi:asialoglycoprotein receptor 2 isoform X4 [Sciurus carolinensis]|uniref:asialoglycoprotein receptor 2 isoform X4 n=1 Tax=Sciurus carolinensis TaxID=30640 RepID=UPI001FB2A0B0|nr:asialoglycoprotein receptor 2 isoform X4 [Sciurus carolinensis]